MDQLYVAEEVSNKSLIFNSIQKSTVPKCMNSPNMKITTSKTHQDSMKKLKAK